jgi:hypothetical protein
MVPPLFGASRIHWRIVKGKKRVKIDAEAYETPAYWEALLTDFGLSMERGISHKIAYMDTEGMQVAENKLHNTGRVAPKKTDL